MQYSTDNNYFNTARFHLVKNYMSRGFTAEEVSEVTGILIDTVNYEINKLVKEAERHRSHIKKSLEGMNISDGFGYNAGFH
jgi:hypothetical protein